VAEVRRIVFQAACAKRDELWHPAMYGWILVTLADGESALLDIQTPYIEPYLARVANSTAAPPSHRGLYARFLVRRGRFKEAATHLANRAESEECVVRPLTHTHTHTHTHTQIDACIQAYTHVCILLVCVRDVGCGGMGLQAGVVCL
jgi:hypothetical protein